MPIQIIKPDSEDQKAIYDKKIFLAGSIEMGAAVDWQKEVEAVFANHFFKERNNSATVYNPRRINWDSSWEQSIDNEQFRNQVEWELNRLFQSNLIFMYLDENTKSPISLLELGLYAQDTKLVVVCGENFWRRGNVEVTCNYFDVPLIIHNPREKSLTDLLIENEMTFLKILYKLDQTLEYFSTVDPNFSLQALKKKMQ